MEKITSPSRCACKDHSSQAAITGIIKYGMTLALIESAN